MNRPIRVLELRTVLGTGGGPDKTILAGARFSDPAHVKTTVCYIRDLRDKIFAIDRRAAELGLNYLEIPERHSLDPAIWRALRTIVRREQIDIVHAHDHKTDFLTWALSKCEPIIPLSTAHGFSGILKRERMYYVFEKRLLARFPRVIAVSAHIKDELVRTGSRPERITVINNAIDPQVFQRDPSRRESARAALGLAPEDCAIGAVGRLEQEKRFDLLIDAFAELRKRHPRAMLLIVGGGSLHASLEQQIAGLGLQQACRLLGHRTDVIALHHAFDAFVQSSEREGTPNCVLEAMAMETPIVATDVGGTSALVLNGEHGLLVERNQPAAMVAALERLLSDPAAARERVNAARRRVETTFSFEERMRKVETVYEELMKTPDLKVGPAYATGKPALRPSSDR